MNAAAGRSENSTLMGVLIAQANFLQGVDSEEVARLLGPASQEVNRPPGHQLFSQDTPVDCIYALLEGRVRMERRVKTPSGARGRALRCEVDAGAFLGHHELLFRRNYMTTAVCIEPCRLIAIDAGGMNRLIYHYPAVRERLVNMRLIDRLRILPVFKRFEQAVLSYLADMCDGENIDYPAGHEFYAEGAAVDTVYLLDAGHVQLEWSDGYQAWLGNGGLFGVALDAQAGPSSGRESFAARHRAVALGATRAIPIKRKRFIDLTGMDPDQQGRDLLQLREKTMTDLLLFQELDVTRRRKLSGYMSHYFIPTNHLLMQQGELADSLWVLLPGSRARVHALNPDGSALLSTDVRGLTFFSEGALALPLPVDSTLEADAGSEWMRLHRRDFDAFAAEERLSNLGRRLFGGSAQVAAATTNSAQTIDVTYPWMEEGEVVIALRRRHWLEVLRKCWFALVVFIVLLLSSGMGWLGAGQPLVRWFMGGLAVAGLLQMIWGVVDYLNDFLVVTNRRLVRQEKVIFFRELRQEAALEQVQNVDVSRKLIGNLLGYGDLKIQTAAEQGKILFDLVPEPENLKADILKEQDTRRRHRVASGKNEIRRLLESRLGRKVMLPERVHAGKPVVAPEPARPNWRERFFGGLRPIQRLHLQRQVGNRMIWRKHWAVLLGKAAAPLATLILLLVVAAAPVMLPLGLERFATSYAYYEVVVLFFAFLSLCWLLWVVADWRNDTYEVDDTQVVDSEKRPLALSSTRRTAFLNQIENVELSIPSPIHYLLNFGNVRLQTAATDGDFSFNWVPDPHGVAAEIQRRIEAFRVNEEQRRAQQRAQELPDWFETYNHIGDEPNRWDGGRPDRATSRS